MVLEVCQTLSHLHTWSLIVSIILFVDESVWPPADMTCRRVTAPGKKQTNSVDFGPNGKVFDESVTDSRDLNHTLKPS